MLKIFAIWIMVKPWPIWAIAMVYFIHNLIISLFHLNYSDVNHFIGPILQVLGGIIVLFVINGNIKTLKKENILKLVINWLKSCPLIKRHYTLNVDPAFHSQISCMAKMTLKHKCNTIDELQEEFSRQIDELLEVINQKENVMIERISSVESKLKESINMGVQELQQVNQQLNDSVIGSVKEEVFGVFLVIYGALILF